jgi:hypothetical protein
MADVAELVRLIKNATSAAEIRRLRGALRRAVQERDVADMTGPGRTIDPDEAAPGRLPDERARRPVPDEPEPTPPRRPAASRVIVGEIDDPNGWGRKNDLRRRGALGL